MSRVAASLALYGETHHLIFRSLQEYEDKVSPSPYSLAHSRPPARPLPPSLANGTSVFSIPLVGKRYYYRARARTHTHR